jgi:hypothetical protein
MLRASTSDSPLVTYSRIEPLLRARADERVRQLDTALELRGVDGAFAPGFESVEVLRPGTAGLRITPDGLLTFAIDVPRASWISGELTLDPDTDVRPGLRATLLCDTTVVAAPMSAAPEWRVGEITEPAPRITGTAPPRVVSLQPWLAQRGRRYLTLAGPHFRPGGTFVSLALRRVDRPVEEPLYQFAFISDTHVRRNGREDWMNRKMGDVSAPELARTLTSLATEGVAFVIHGGDLTENATRDQFQLIRSVFAAQTLPVYACLGNHDRYLPASRIDALELLAPHFPAGALDYAFHRPPLRFIVMDVAIEDDAVREEKVGWLRETLAEDTHTPTVFVWHYPPFNSGAVSSCGYRLQDWSDLGRGTVLDVLQRSPNVVAAINGHDHWDEVNTIGGVTLVQNAAFVEWPNSYRVYRVYRDRLEWDVRQVANRGFVRESFLPSKAMSWMIAAQPTDLRGAIPLARRS